ncbi:MAG: xanthine dehydrogenase family protein subunit M [bacterium]|nr:xanthine dehydrogenase family protein subunit M [bacterium]
MKQFAYCSPVTIREAVEALVANPGARVLAGGTDLLVRMKARVSTPGALVDIGRIPRLCELIYDRKTGLRMGAGVTMQQAALSPEVQTQYAAIAQGAGLVGSVQIRNLATVVGNVCNAAPSADTAPGLIALGAKVRISGPDGRRSVLVEKFMIGPGKTVLKPGELVTAIQVPVPAARTGSAYARHTPREAMDIAMVGVGVSVTLAPRSEVCKEVRIVMGAVGLTPLRARAAEKLLKGEKLTEDLIKAAAVAAAGEAKPIDDVRGSAAFRREMVRVLTHRMLEAAYVDATRKTGEKRRAA